MLTLQKRIQCKTQTICIYSLNGARTLSTYYLGYSSGVTKSRELHASASCFVANKLRAERSGVGISAAETDFCILQEGPNRLWSPPILPVNGYRGSLSGVKWSGPEVDHSPPSSEEVEND